MELNRYQALAAIYRRDTANDVYAVLGLSGEVGELHSLIAKSIRDNTEIGTERVLFELGDILWFVAAIADDAGLTLDEIAKTNIVKLDGRAIRGTIGGSGDDR